MRDERAREAFRPSVAGRPAAAPAAGGGPASPPTAPAAPAPLAATAAGSGRGDVAVAVAGAEAPSTPVRSPGGAAVVVSDLDWGRYVSPARLEEPPWPRIQARQFQFLVCWPCRCVWSAWMQRPLPAPRRVEVPPPPPVPLLIPFPCAASLNKKQPETPLSDSLGRATRHRSASSAGPVPYPPYPTDAAAHAAHAAHGTSGTSGASGTGGTATAWMAFPTSATMAPQEAQGLFGDAGAALLQPAEPPQLPQPQPQGAVDAWGSGRPADAALPFEGPWGPAPPATTFDAFGTGSDPFFRPSDDSEPPGWASAVSAAAVSALTAPVLHPDRPDFLDYAEAAR